MSVREKGFTLIELMVALAVLAILLLVAVPNFSIFMSEARVDSAKNKLISAVGFARSEAIKRGVAVAICRKQADPNNTCSGTSMAAGNADWSNGWVVFLDEDDDQTLDANELLRLYADIDTQSSIQFTRGDVVVFDGLGLLNTAATGDETFAVSDSVDSSVGAGLSVRPTGRIRMCSDWLVGTSTCND